MDKYSTSLVPVQKGEIFNLIQCSKSEFE